VQGKYEQAEKSFDRALEINAENVEALHNKAILLAMKKQFREAAEINKKVLELAPDWPPALRFRDRLDRMFKKE
jgi:tetratricopeptide (TPR) repeat protein